MTSEPATSGSATEETSPVRGRSRWLYGLAALLLAGLGALSIYQRQARIAEGRTIRQVSLDGRYVVYRNGTTLDTATRLMWTAQDTGEDLSWSRAARLAERATRGGHWDWRLPTLAELRTLHRPERRFRFLGPGGPGIEVQVTPYVQVTSCCIWASDTRDGKQGLFAFTDGQPAWEPPNTVRLVRALFVRDVTAEAVAAEASRVAAR